MGKTLQNLNPQKDRSKNEETGDIIDKGYNTLTKSGFPTSKTGSEPTFQKKIISRYESSKTENARLLGVLLH